MSRADCKHSEQNIWPVKTRQRWNEEQSEYGKPHTAVCNDQARGGIHADGTLKLAELDTFILFGHTLRLGDFI